MDPNAKAGSPPSPQEPLSEADYDRLGALLERAGAADAMDPEKLDGFFAALICGPDLVPPSEYLEEIWEGEETPFETVEELREFLDLIMRHWNRIAGALADPDQIFEPLLFAEDGEDLPRGNRWAQGFLRGISMCRQSWKEIFADDDKFAMLMPIFALAHENDPDPEMRSWKTPPDRELRGRLIVGLSVAAQKIYDYFRTHRAREARRRANGERDARPKIGRNGPCYCGSGKKYKKCCGNVTIN
jgi:uncharacterized protein